MHYENLFYFRLSLLFKNVLSFEVVIWWLGLLEIIDSSLYLKSSSIISLEFFSLQSLIKKSFQDVIVPSSWYCLLKFCFFHELLIDMLFKKLITISFVIHELQKSFVFLYLFKQNISEFTLWQKSHSLEFSENQFIYLDFENSYSCSL